METRNKEKEKKDGEVNTLTEDTILGSLLEEFEPKPGTQLPCNADVLKHYIFLTRGLFVNFYFPFLDTYQLPTKNLYNLQLLCHMEWIRSYVEYVPTYNTYTLCEIIAIYK